MIAAWRINDLCMLRGGFPSGPALKADSAVGYFGHVVRNLDTGKGHAQRTITIAKMLQEPQRNAELASGALVSSAPSSSDTGSRVIPQIPMSAERANRAAVLFGRTESVED